MAGPAYVRFPLFLLAAFLCDVLPRVLLRHRRLGRPRPGGLVASFRAVLHERWRPTQVRFMFIGLVGWYVTYATFRNLKNAVPFVNDALWDNAMERSTTRCGSGTTRPRCCTRSSARASPRRRSRWSTSPGSG